MLRLRVNVRDLHLERADACSSVYAIGDIHGRLDLLIKMEEAIRRDVASGDFGPAAICYLGDYIDRGPQSADVVERLCSPIDDGIERVFLMGNHEDRLLDFLDDPTRYGPSWLRYGGREAMESYGITLPATDADVDWLEFRDRFLITFPASHRTFIEGLHPGLFWRNYLFVHAGINPDARTDSQALHDLMWIREPFLSHEGDWGLTVVHGHTVFDTPQIHDNRIGVDTGAYQSGILSAVKVTDSGCRILQVSQL
ncbi:metallophosphoesterase family protein [Sphingobium aromaticiconvertens]|uniref:metallophosphoesterase family protein n=1 Tax=Sphingobium aromaticiconvertens TaxID=365341 RepID=UPI00301653D4